MANEDFYSWSLTAANNGTADTGINWAEGMPRASVNDSARAMMAALAKWRNLTGAILVTGGSANAHTVTSGVGYSTIPTGLRCLLVSGVAAANSGAITLDMDSTGPVEIIYPSGGGSLTAGEVSQYSYLDLLYNGTHWVLLSRAKSEIAAGTQMIFTQTAAPTGWVKVAGVNDRVLRLVDGTASSGGSVPFSTLFGRTTTDNHTLLTAEIPSHQHTKAAFQGAGNMNGDGYFAGGDGVIEWNFASTQSMSGIYGIEYTGGSGVHSHNIDMRVTYLDAVVAYKAY